MLTSWIAGFVMGAAGSIPVAGPTTMLVLSFGLQGRIRTAAMIALGSAVPEGIWAALGLWGFSALLATYTWAEPVSEAAAVVILLVVGGLLLVRPPAAEPTLQEEPTDVGGALRAGLLGLSLTGLNPTLLVNWGAAVTLAVSVGALEPASEHAIPFGVGVAMGIVAWFAFVLHLLGRHHRRIPVRARSWLLRGMGIALVALGFVAGTRLALKLV